VHNNSLSICLINRNYPPYRGATGYYASHLVDAIKSRTSHDIHVVTMGDEQSTSDITYLRTGYNGRQKLLRLINAYRESGLLIEAAIKRTPDIFIVMTDPALLNYWASKRLNNKIWVYWSMDLYPEGFRANNLISTRNFFYKKYQSVLKKGKPSYILGLGIGQISYVKKEYFPEAEASCLPIGLRDKASDVLSIAVVDRDKPTAGYVGNVGEAHDPILIAECLLAFARRGFRVVLRCYGVGAKGLLSLVEDSTIEIIDRLSDEELKGIDIHIVSLRKEWTHICVPSKAVSALQSGNTVVYLGSPESDTWRMSETAGWIIQTSSDVSSVVEKITKDSLSMKKKAAVRIAAELKINYKEGLSSFFTFLEKIKSKKT